MEYYSAIKKTWNCAAYREMDGPRDCHTEWSESDVEIQMLCDITYMWNLKTNDTNELIYRTETYKFQKQT